MGSKLSCSCSPAVKKCPNENETPFHQQRRRDGHLLRLWAEVFHVSAASGAIRWQQITQDLVPVNITCIQDTPECIFQITAYNSQVEKILDVRLVQPGTRLGQASECFVYWKDTATGDTWGLNFTSAEDAKQFRFLCSPSFKISRKASSSYSLLLHEAPPKRYMVERNASSKKRKPQSTPSSPSRRVYGSELQCTCMTADTLHKQRNGRVRYTGSSTIPKSAFARQDGQLISYSPMSSVQGTGQRGPMLAFTAQGTQDDKSVTAATLPAQSQTGHLRTAQYSRAQYAQYGQKEQNCSIDSTLYQNERALKQATNLKSKAKFVAHNYNTNTDVKSRSKSTDDVRRTVGTATDDLQFDSNVLKKMLHPLNVNSLTSNEAILNHVTKMSTTGTNTVTTSTPSLAFTRETVRNAQRPTSISTWNYTDRFTRDQSTETRRRSDTNRRRSLERTQCIDYTDQSPTSESYFSDNVNQYYANRYRQNSKKDEENQPVYKKYVQKVDQATQKTDKKVGSPTIKLLQEYEQHLRNALAKGCDVDSYSLNAFETILSQSMENVVVLMSEVQNELDAIRREEQQYHSEDNYFRSRSNRPYWSTKSLNISPRGSSLPPSLKGSSTTDLCSAFRKSSTSAFDTLSVDGGYFTNNSSHRFHTPSYESTDLKVYLTSSEVSDINYLTLKQVKIS